MMRLSMITSCLAILLFLNTFAAQCQGLAEEKWNQGLVILKTSDTLKGFLKYNLKNAVVRIKINNTIRTYSPRKVISFLFFDVRYHRNRQFYSIPYAVRRSSNYKVLSFFELIRNGDPLTLLSRQTTFMKRVSRLGGFYRRVEQDVFYLLDATGKIKRVRSSRRGVYKAFSKHERAIRAYMEVNGLKHSRRQDLAKVLDYYNSLSNNNDR